MSLTVLGTFPGETKIHAGKALRKITLVTDGRSFGICVQYVGQEKSWRDSTVVRLSLVELQKLHKLLGEVISDKDHSRP